MKSAVYLCAMCVCVLSAAPTFAESDYEAVVDDSVVGYWRFNDPNDYGKDSSGHGSGIVQWIYNVSGGVVSVSTDWSRGGGCLELPRGGKGTAPSPYTYGTGVATLTSGKTLDMSRKSPGWTVVTWVRGSAELVSSLKNASLAPDGTDAGDFKNALKDGKWHPLVIVYRPNRKKDFYHVYVNAFDSKKVTDITSGGTDAQGAPAWHIPLSVTSNASANDTVNLGGEIGGTIDLGVYTKTINATFFGGLDDCIIIDRELIGGGEPTDEEEIAGTVRTDDEVFRLVRTGETFVYTKGSSGDMLYQKGDWSNGKEPQEGLVYMIENGHEVRSTRSQIFAGKSLSVGRTEKLYGITSVGGAKTVIVDNTVGWLTQARGHTTMTIDDLVLNDGALTSLSNNQTLVSNIRVRAPASNPFKIAVSNGTYTVSGTMTGSGSISKIGPATLDLSAVSNSTAKVLLSEGSLLLSSANPTLSGYDGGTLLVNFDENEGTATTVTIDASWAGALSFKLNGKPSKVGRYVAISVPTSVKTVTAADFANETVCASGMTTRTKVVVAGSVQTVCVECLPVADLNGSPALGFE